MRLRNRLIAVAALSAAPSSGLFAQATITLDNATLDSLTRVSLANTLLIKHDLTFQSGGAIGIGDLTTPPWTYGRVIFGGGTQNLVGAGEIFFDNYFDVGIGLGNGTLTIAPDVTIRTNLGNGRIDNAFGTSGDLLVNQGLITATAGHTFGLVPFSYRNEGHILADTGGTIGLTGLGSISTNAATGLIEIAPSGTLSLAGTWQNLGRIRNNGGALIISGTFTTSGIGDVQCTNGGTLALGGKFDLANGSLNITAQTGSWYLNSYSQLVNGTINCLDGTKLIAASPDGSTLDHATLNGDFVASPESTIYIQNGLTLNGTMNLGPGTYHSTLRPLGVQTISGNGTLLFNSSSVDASFVYVTSNTTLGSNITVHESNGTAIFNQSAQLINQGTILVDGTHATLRIEPASWTNQGIMKVSDGTLVLGGTFSSGSLGSIAHTGGHLLVSGQWNNVGTYNIAAGCATLELNSGTIAGGTITQNGGMLQFDQPTGSTQNYLDNVFLAGGVHLEQAFSFVDFLNGSHFSGDATLGTNAQLQFAVTDLFSNYTGAVHLAPGASLSGSGSFNLGSQAIVTGPSGTVGLPGDTSTMTNSGTISASNSVGVTNGLRIATKQFTNQGRVESVNSGSLIIDSSSWENTSSGVLYAGASAAMELRQSWSNSGAITVDGGTLILGGSFATASLSGLSRNGGTVRVAGVWNNAGTSFAFGSSTGDWILDGGILSGGQVSQQTDGKLRFSSHTPNELRNVVVLGGLDLSAADLRVKLTGSSTFFGDATVNSSDLQFSAEQGAIPSLDNGNTISMTNGRIGLINAVTLNIGPSVTIHGSGSIKQFSGSGASFINRGSLLADTPNGTLQMLMAFTNQGLLGASNNGTIQTSFATTNSGSISVNGGIATFADISGAGTITVGDSSAGALSATRIRQNGLTIGASSTVTVKRSGTNLTVSILPSLTLDPTATFDLTKEALVVDYSSATPFNTIKSSVVGAYTNGSWNGKGITSSDAKNSGNGHFGIGIAEASSLFATFPASFQGQTVDSTSVLLRYTACGDLNLDGKVNTSDFTGLAKNFGKTGQNWVNGDFNYDGTVNALDFNAVASNFGQVLTEPELGATVPEPSTALASLIVLYWSRRRRAI